VHAVVPLEPQAVGEISFREHQDSGYGEPGSEQAECTAVLSEIPKLPELFPADFIDCRSHQQKQRREKDSIAGVAADGEDRTVNDLEGGQPAGETEIAVAA